MNDQLIQQGLDLMLFGVGIVFIFLVVLVLVTSLMSKVIMTFFPEQEEELPSVPPVTVSRATVDGTVLKVIQNAIDQHRGRQ